MTSPPSSPMNPVGGGHGARPTAAATPAKVGPSKLMTSAPATGAVAALATQSVKAASKKGLLIAGGSGAVVLVAAISLLIWRPWKAEPPRLNDPPEKIVKFVASADFESLPFTRQRTYMEKLDQLEDQVKKAHLANTISDEEYSAAKQAAWYGKRLSRMSNYLKEPPGPKRNAYIDKLLDKRAKKKEKEEDEENERPAKDPKTGGTVKRDDSHEDEQIAKWPVEVQAQWTDFMAAYRNRKDLRKEKEAASTQQVLPVKPPATKSGK